MQRIATACSDHEKLLFYWRFLILYNCCNGSKQRCLQRMTTSLGNYRHPFMKLSLGQAAKETGVDKSTISRAIKSGKLSAHRKESGGYEIDPAELFRVFSPASQKHDPVALPPDIPTETLLENRELRIKLEAAELRIRDKEEEARDLRRRLDTESEERRKLTLMLLAQPQSPQSKEQSEKADTLPMQQPAPPLPLQQSTTPIAHTKKGGIWAWLLGKA
jgi:hypothetical protein